MKAVRPFGDLATATILIIGHDPRLQRSQTEAEIAFFFDYLTRPRPKSRPEARKYDLAQAVTDHLLKNLSTAKREQVLRFCAEEKLLFCAEEKLLRRPFSTRLPSPPSPDTSSRCARSGGGCRDKDRRTTKDEGQRVASDRG